jgi:hypothetical protein
MLPCERPHNRPPLSREEFERQLPLFLADYVLVLRHLVSSPQYYSPDLQSMQALYAVALEPNIPSPELLNRVVGYVLNQMYWNERSGPLTPDEQEIYAAAWRLSDSMWGPRNTN